MEGKIDFIILLVFLVFAITVIICLESIRISSTREGVHNGYVTAIEQEGYIFPNYRVYVKTDNSSSQEDVYCLYRTKQALVEELKKASRAKEKVSIHFNGVRGIGLDLCSGEEITGIEEL